MRIFSFVLVIEFIIIIKHENDENIEVIIMQNKTSRKNDLEVPENRQRKIIDLTSYTSTEKWKQFESITHVHINRLGTTPLLCLSFVLISADFVEVLLKSGLKVLLRSFHKGTHYLVPYSCYFYNQMSTTQDIQILLMERYICPHPIHNQTLIDTSKVFWRSNTYTCI